MTKDQALKLALSTLDEVRSETFRLLRNGQKLYAEEKVWDTIAAIKEALAQRKPLTDEEIEEIAARTLFPINFARGSEAAHGIKENT